MSLSKKKQLGEQQRKKVWGIEKTHPYKTLFFLGSMAISLAILFLLFSFWFFDRNFQALESMILPKGLIISVLILMGIAFVSSQGSNHIEKENLRALSFSFRLILFLACLYLVVSLDAWRNLVGNFEDLQASPGKTFLLLIAGIHFFQFLMGIAMTLYSYYKLGVNSQDPIKKLVFVTNKFELTILEISFYGWYWIASTGLIIFLVLLYLLN